MDPASVKKRFDKRAGEGGGKEEAGRPPMDQGAMRPQDRISILRPGEGPNTTAATYVPPVRGDQRRSAAPSAEQIAMATIDQAGTPPVKRAPTQEDVNQNPKSYQRFKADVDTDVGVQETETEE
jgi:hypothetical protein